MSFPYNILKICNNVWSKGKIDSLRSLSTSIEPTSDLSYKRNFLFSEEKKRQYESIGRVEKIEVNVAGPPENVTLLMNKEMSTPHDCAKHISESVIDRAALSIVDDTTLWDMHQPLTAPCSLKFLHFKDADPHFVNKAFWRTCSVVLGAVISNAFKQNVQVLLHSFPSPNVRSGSFVYDVHLNLSDWSPTTDELRVLSSEMVKYSQLNLDLERLTVDKELALEIFDGNRYKQEQIPKIAAQNQGNEVILYRVGKHIDVSRGPMVGNTSFIGRCTVASVHKIGTEEGELYRFQGVALPKGIMLNHFAYSILEDRAKRLNQGRFPGANPSFSEDYLAVTG